MFLQAIALIGSVFILVAYYLLQRGRLARESQLFNAMNFFGSCLLTWTAVANRQYGFILLEGAWALLSLPGTLRAPPQK
jgi:hypothetical protein